MVTRQDPCQYVDMRDVRLGITVGCCLPGVFLSDWLHLPLEPIADLDAFLKGRGYRKVAALFGSPPHLQEATT